jgi:8-oxo-dGTP diphosphatase
VKQFRNSAKAIIIQDGHLLAIRYIDPQGEYYTLPGGGQEAGETLVQALKRECCEELGIEIEVGALRYIREYIGSNHEFAEHDSGVHQVEHMFICRLTDELAEEAGSIPDPGQLGFAWLPVERLTSTRLYPKYLRPLLKTGPDFSGPVYVGDVN